MPHKNNLKKHGLIALLGITISILTYMYVARKLFFDNTTKLYAFIDDPSGLSTNSIVKMNGFEIGKVSDIKIVNHEVLLELSINDEITLSKTTQFSSTSNNILGDKQIEVENINEGSKMYTSGDTIQAKILIKGIFETFDSDNKFEPALKALSKTIGTALIEYSESNTTMCNSDQLVFVLNRIENHPDNLNEKDAHILIENHCSLEIEYSQLQNKLTFKLLEINPASIINTLENNNYDQEQIIRFYDRVENPIDDSFDLKKIIKSIENQKDSNAKKRLLESLRI